jgi:hypothetical protein
MKIQEQWESYLTNVVPKSAGATQILETKRAFYAGAETALNLMLLKADDSDQESLDEGAAFVQALFTELDEFSKSQLERHEINHHA